MIVPIFNLYIKSQTLYESIVTSKYVTAIEMGA